MGLGGIPQQGAPCILLVAMLYKSEQSSSDSRPSLGALNLCAREKDSFARLSLAEQGVALRETLGTGPPVTLLAFGFAMSQLRLSPLFH